MYIFQKDLQSTRANIYPTLSTYPVEYHHIIWCSLCTYSVFILLFIMWMDEELNPWVTLFLKVSRFLWSNCNYLLFTTGFTIANNVWCVTYYLLNIKNRRKSSILWISRLEAFNIPQICLPTTIVLISKYNRN